jgi:hypothetical protein
MFGLGIQEVLIFLVVAALWLGGMGLLYLVIRAAVRAGNRDR